MAPVVKNLPANAEAAADRGAWQAAVHGVAESWTGVNTDSK